MSPASTPEESLLELIAESVEPAANDVLAVRLSSSTPLPAWTAGSHVGVHLGNDLLRQYSLCGDPDDRFNYRIAVLREPESRGGSAWIHEQLHPGDKLSISQPRNNFDLLPATRYVFVAGGIGITPILPMIRQAHADQSDWRLLYGGRSRASMAFVDELQEYGDRVILHPQDEAGFLPLTEWLSNPLDSTLVYTCGPEPLLRAVEEATAAWPSTAVHFERFRAPDEIATEGDQPIEVELARTGKTITVPADTSILEALEAEGMIVLSSCREGTCGTCETKVLRGKPDHRDWVLSDAEKESNETMMVCVSRACDGRLVLDL